MHDPRATDAVAVGLQRRSAGLSPNALAQTWVSSAASIPPKNPPTAPPSRPLSIFRPGPRIPSPLEAAIIRSNTAGATPISAPATAQPRLGPTGGATVARL